MVRNRRQFLFVFSLLLLFPAKSIAVYEIVEIEKPFHARTLSGVVLGPDGSPVIGTTVEERDATFRRVLATVETDANGRFSFPRAKSGTSHHLELRARGFNPLRVTISLGRFAKKTVLLTLPIGG
jgi:hypothetical protein